MKRILSTALLFAAVASAQDAGSLFDKVQIHGYLSQGFLFSSANNYLTTKSSDGSLRWTEGAINFGTPVTDELRVGMQLRSYSLGQFGKQKVEIDWAYGDYKLNNYFGFRAGKVKTPMGLYNDSQDVDAVQTWALLPQSIYPTDNRSYNLAHNGGVVYGSVDLKRAGSISYQAFAGSRSLDQDGGTALQLLQGTSRIAFTDATGPVYGVDMRWRTPIKGLTPGVTFSSVHLSDSGATASGYPVGMDIKAKMKNFYAEFERGKLYLGAELKETPIRFGVAKSLSMVPQRAWFILGSYHLTNKLTAGAYYSQFLNDKTVSNDPSRFSKDTVVSSRFDANQYFYFKLEGHYIHGNGEGFYPVGNAPVLQKNTRLLVARVGFTF